MSDTATISRPALTLPEAEAAHLRAAYEEAQAILESAERCAIFEPILKAYIENYVERRTAGEAHDEVVAGMMLTPPTAPFAADEPEEAGL